MSVFGDFVLPFQIDKYLFRGRLVRLNHVLDTILHQHPYPDIVSHLLGETIILSVLLSDTLKYDGIFTLQTKGDGAIPIIVSDVTSTGNIRAYAQYDEEKCKKLEGLDTKTLSISDLLGSGYLAFTVDQGGNTDRYQGIVELKGETMGACIDEYFHQSEQLQTQIKYDLYRIGQNNRHWHGSGIMVQRLPRSASVDETNPILLHDPKEGFDYVKMLFQTLTEDELKSADLVPEDLLYRLFHDQELRVYDKKKLRFKCRCSREKLLSVLKNFSQEEIDSLKKDGVISSTCQFCHKEYSFKDL